MADIVDFDQYDREPDLDAMSRDQLLAYQKDLWDQIAQLDEQEPEDMNSEAYEVWGDRHEMLEDLADEVRDRLDDLD